MKVNINLYGYKFKVEFVNKDDERIKGYYFIMTS